MSEANLKSIFKTVNSDRDAFLSRVFGIFNEEIIRIWCRDDRSPYVDLGRPTVRIDNSKRGSTLDFTFHHKASGSQFVAEMKCELQYKNYEYLVLTEPAQLEHHNKKAFADFLKATRAPNKVSVTVPAGNSRRSIEVSGGVLIWGSITDGGRSAVMDRYGFADVLSLEKAIADLNRWHNREYKEHVSEWMSWCRELFDGLRLMT